MTFTIQMSEGVAALLKAQRLLFIEKFGREPRPSDPVFFDPEKKTPVRMTAQRMIELIKKWE